MDRIGYSLLVEGAKVPSRKNPTDAGIDIYALEEIIVEAHSFAIVRTGISLETPKGYVLLIKPKGRSNHLVGAGVVDPGYFPGEILVKIANPTAVPKHIGKGEAIAQVLVLPMETPELFEVSLNTKYLQQSETWYRSGKGGIVTELHGQE